MDNDDVDMWGIITTHPDTTPCRGCGTQADATTIISPSALFRVMRDSCFTVGVQGKNGLITLLTCHLPPGLLVLI